MTINKSHKQAKENTGGVYRLQQLDYINSSSHDRPDKQGAKIIQSKKEQYG